MLKYKTQTEVLYMNIEFVSKDNEAKVFDENNNGKKINNTDNIEEILIKEKS